MKTKIFLLMLVFTSIVINVNAQLKIYSGGNIAIGGTSFTPNSPLTIGSGSSALGNSTYKAYIFNSSTSNNTVGLFVNLAGAGGAYRTYGIFSKDTSGYTGSGCYAYGIYGNAYKTTASTYGVHYGVYGVAGNATAGRNYGVFGILAGTKDGAGIYGTTSTDVTISGKYAGYFFGDVKITDTVTAYRVKYYSLVNMSDQRLKKNIVSLTNTTFDKISQLNAVEYQYKSKQELIADGSIEADISDTSTTDGMGNSIDTRLYYGYIAQDLQPIFPELVYQDKDGFLGINYVGLIPLMIEEIKQQNATITDLQKQINDCCTKGTNQKTTGQNSTDDNNANAEALLYQNTPNPFSRETQIKCFIPDNAMVSDIFIYDMQGKQLVKIQINGKGEETISIQSSELIAGMYMYTLIIDGKEIDTKKMILTD